MGAYFNEAAWMDGPPLFFVSISTGAGLFAFVVAAVGMWATLFRCPHVHSLWFYGLPVLPSLRKRWSFRQVASKERCWSSDAREMSGPSSSSRAASKTSPIGRFLSRGVSCRSEMISPPRSHRLSRCLRRVLRDKSRLRRWRKNGLKHSTICWPGDKSRSSYLQLPGH